MIPPCDAAGKGNPHRRPYQKLASPTRFRTVKKSKAIRRKSTFASCEKVSPKCRVMSCAGRLDVVCRSLVVAKESPLAPILETMTFDVNHYASLRYSKRISSSRLKRRFLGLRQPKNTPKTGFGASAILTYVDFRHDQTTATTVTSQIVTESASSSWLHLKRVPTGVILRIVLETHAGELAWQI